MGMGRGGGVAPPQASAVSILTPTALQCCGHGQEEAHVYSAQSGV